jgi:hypothetical protein
MPKLVTKVDTTGLFVEDTEVDDSFNGVVPFYTDPQPDEEGNTPEPQLAGYTVGIAAPDGFYKPRFNIPAWEAYQAAHIASQQAFTDALEDWDGEGEAPVFIPPEQPTGLWSEGMSAEEIAELTKPSPPSEIELLKQQLAETQAQNTALSFTLAEFFYNYVADQDSASYGTALMLNAIADNQGGK